MIGYRTYHLYKKIPLQSITISDLMSGTNHYKIKCENFWVGFGHILYEYYILPSICESRVAIILHFECYIHIYWRNVF